MLPPYTTPLASPRPRPPRPDLVTNALDVAAVSKRGTIAFRARNPIRVPDTPINSVVFECTWRGCGHTTNSCSSIEGHIRNTLLGPKKEGESDHEEEFYYTERELLAPPPPPTLSHRDMCRPPHEDPDYQRQLVGSYRQGLLSTLQNGSARPISIPVSHPWSSSHSPKHMRLSGMTGSPGSPGRRPRSDNKKCRKVYGMDQRDLWCTQCKWKKACTRFNE
ncbi:Zinc finger protein 704 [Papilio xuthus]|uniref:Zinc finger protein 704 n=1 Tax=Papilio xuthus TaxID=66420 RepID=A0A194PK58_PAPXU|nr:Zinc finger protein 704 [Papilio xuthus]